MELKSLKAFCDAKNERKRLLTPGPGALLVENLIGLEPCFGRGDPSFEAIKQEVIGFLAELTGKQTNVGLQGSASLALEMGIANFVSGRVLVVNAGYYSNRLLTLCQFWKANTSIIESIDEISLAQFLDGAVVEKYDWVVATSTETGLGLRLPIDDLRDLADKSDARLFLDATASIGLERGHHKADVLAYSSCKGLFGFTGAAFISTDIIDKNPINSFYLDFETHKSSGVTGPYHTICSLLAVSRNHEALRSRVLEHRNLFLKKYADALLYPIGLQPILCTRVNIPTTVFDSGKNVIYEPRGVGQQLGTTVCHLVDLDRQENMQGKTLNLR